MTTQGRPEGAQGSPGALPAWLPAGVPLDRPNAARMYDYFLGGYHNFAVDRKAGDAATAIYPEFPLVMQANRAFLRRAVKFLVAQGVDRFLDLGAGIPTVDNTHQVAHKVNPDCRVVYVDNDPIAVAHSTALLREEPNVTIIQADVVDYRQVLAHPAVQGLLQPGQPVALMLLALLHFVLDDQTSYQMVRDLVDVLPSGSYLVITHGTFDGLPPDAHEQMMRLYSSTTNPVRLRSRAEVQRYFDGLELIEPGVTYVPSWRPEGPDELFIDQPAHSVCFGAVARKP